MAALDRFLDRLRQTPRTWTVAIRPPFAGYRLRCGFGCPITVVAGYPDECDWYVHFPATGLDGPTAHRVAQAADDTPGHDPHLRLALLQACGLAHG